MCFQEGLPGDLRLAEWGGLEATAEDVANRGRPKDVTEVLERALDALVTPAWVVLGYLDNQRGEVAARLRSAGRPSASRHGSSDELAMPGKDPLGRPDRCDLGEKLAAEHHALHCQAAALIIAQAEALSAELLLQ